MHKKQGRYLKLTSLPEIQAFIRDGLFDEHFPRSLHLEPTSRCNMECIFCLGSKYKYRVKDMAMSLFRMIMKESKKHGLRDSIVFSGIGEPLLHRKIVEMVRLAKECAHKVSITTNGLFLSPRLSKEIISANLDSITIGFDGAKRETYEFLRRGSSFETVAGNIKELVAQKKKTKSNIEVIIRAVETKVNRKEIPQIRKMWGGIVDRVETFKDGRETEKVTKRMPCFSLWSQMAINAEGGVYICASEYDQRRTIGDISRESIQKIWQGEAFNHLRERHLKNEVDKLEPCRNCSSWHISNFVSFS